jgi:hypothetical protein
MTILNKENAKTATLIRNIAHPEWGVVSFSYNSKRLNDGKFCSSWGKGSNGAVLFESEYKFWEVIKQH